MADDPIKSFMVSLGFVGNTAEAKKVVDLANATEAAITKAAEGGASDRVDAEKQASAERIGIIGALGKIFVSMEVDRAKREAKIREDAAAKDERLQQEREKKAKERRAAALKEIQVQATRMASFALKAVGAIEATALGIVYATDRAAKGFERLNYASQRTGASAGKITAFGYAAEQTGGDAGSAQSVLEAFGGKMRMNGAAYAGQLKTMGIEVRGANGQMRDSAEILTELGQKLAQIQKSGPAGYGNAMGYASMFGLDERTMLAIEKPEFSQRFKERQAIDAKTGADQGAAAEGGTKFEQSMRKLDAVLESIKTKVETTLFVKLQPQLDKLSAWGEQHGGQVAEVLGRIADDLLKLANAVIDNLAKIDWNAILDSVEHFATEFEKKTKGLFGENGPIIATLAIFGTLIAGKVLGPLNLVLGVLTRIGGLPLVGRLLGGTALAVAAGAIAESTPGAGIPADAAERAKVAEENKRLTDEANARSGQGKGFWNDTWSYLKSKVGFGDADPDARKIKDAIVSTAEGVKKLADNSGMGSGTVNAGGGASLGGGAPNLRYGRKGGGASSGYRETPIPDAPYNGKNIEGLTEAQSKQYAAVLGNRESGNRYGITNPYGYAGRWQFGASALAENGYVKKGTANSGLRNPGNWLGKNGAGSMEDWLKNKDGVQDKALGEYTSRHYAQLKLAGVIKDGMSPAEIAGWLAAAHLKGVDGAIRLSKGHDNVDANGTSASSYRRMMQGIGKGEGATAAAAAAPAPASGMTQADIDAISKRHNAVDRTKPMTADQIKQWGADDDALQAWALAHPGGKMGHVTGPIMNNGKEVAPGPEVRGKARGYKEIDDGGIAGLAGTTPDNAVKVEVTDASAAKLGKAIMPPEQRARLKTEMEASKKRLAALDAAGPASRAHLAATQAVLRAHRGQVMGVDPHSMLGRHIRHSIDNSHRQVSMTHAPVFNMQGGDPHAMLADAHRLAGRGQADLVRNMSVMTA